MAGNATAESITTGAREAQSTLITASTEAANHVKSLTIDVERTLTEVGATCRLLDSRAPRARPRAR